VSSRLEHIRLEDANILVLSFLLDIKTARYLLELFPFVVNLLDHPASLKSITFYSTMLHSKPYLMLRSTELLPPSLTASRPYLPLITMILRSSKTNLELLSYLREAFFIRRPQLFKEDNHYTALRIYNCRCHMGKQHTTYTR
jgi:hypothetical protein